MSLEDAWRPCPSVWPTNALLRLLRRHEEDIAHAIRWGWAPGTTTVRHLFGPVVPWAGLQAWLDRAGRPGLGFASQDLTDSLNPKTPHEGDTE